MKQVALIAAAFFVVLSGAATGAAFYFQPRLIFGETTRIPAASRSVPTYSAIPDAETQKRKNALSLVEQLGAVQDRIIRGDRTALTEQEQLLNDIAHEVRRFGSNEWADYVNVRTSLVYILSGGDARVLKPLIDSNSLSEADQKLAAGIMSFAQGQTRAARKYFKDIDPRSLDVSLVGPFALARASLYLDDDKAKAIELLDDARLACPHTAIDEAAARREIPVLVDTGDTDRAMMLTAGYVRKFGKSIYARKLFRDFAQATANRNDLDDAATVDRLAASLDEKDMEAASELFVDVSGEALLQGRLKLAKAAADRVLKIENASPAILDKARLYAAAAEAPSVAAGDALRALEQNTADRLSDEDTEIREVAGFIAKTVAGEESTARHGGMQGAGNVKTQVSNATAQEPMASSAAAALGKADAILKEADLIISGSAK
jgi:chemotaxis protein MotC